MSAVSVAPSAAVPVTRMIGCAPSIAVGASFTLATVILKMSKIDAPALSVTVTRMSLAPTSASTVGVPEKVRVTGSKRSQLGSGRPSAFSAV